jgi:hypothetical protein
MPDLPQGNSGNLPNAGVDNNSYGLVDPLAPTSPFGDPDKAAGSSATGTGAGSGSASSGSSTSTNQPALPQPAGPATETPEVENAYDQRGVTGELGGIAWPGDSRAAAVSWHCIYLAGERFPGVARIPEAGTKRNVEEKQASGNDGATITDKGRARPKFTIELTLWTSRQWYEFQRLLPLIDPNKDGGPRYPIEVYFPTLALFNITEIYIEEIKVGLPDAQGVMKISMPAGKWAPAPPPVTKAAGSGGKALADQLIADMNKISSGVAAAKEAAYHDPAVSGPMTDWGR